MSRKSIERNKKAKQNKTKEHLEKFMKMELSLREAMTMESKKVNSSKIRQGEKNTRR